MTLIRELTRDGHIHKLTVTQKRTGWEVREEKDSVVLQRMLRSDWHRVESDVRLFDVRAKLLKQSGWTDPRTTAAAHPSSSSAPAPRRAPPGSSSPRSTRSRYRRERRR